MKRIAYWIFSTFLIIFIFGSLFFIGLRINESGASFGKVWSWLFILLGIAFEVGASHRLRGFWNSVVSKPNQEKVNNPDQDSASYNASFWRLRILGISLMIGGIAYNITSSSGVLILSLIIPLSLSRLLFVKKNEDVPRN